MVRFPIFAVVRVIGVAITALVLIWCVHFRGGLALVSEDKRLIFNVNPFYLFTYFPQMNEGSILFSKLPRLNFEWGKISGSSRTNGDRSSCSEWGR